MCDIAYGDFLVQRALRGYTSFAYFSNFYIFHGFFHFRVREAAMTGLERLCSLIVNKNPSLMNAEM